MIKVMIVEAWRMARDAVALYINSEQDFEIVAEIASAASAESICEKENIDIIVMSICTENNSSGIDATYIIKKRFPHIKIILITGLPEISFLERAKKAGADGFVYKTMAMPELIAVLRNVINGYKIFPDKSYNPLWDTAKLTQREMEILRLCSKGKSRAEIAGELNISEGSVKTYITRILNKTGYANMSKLTSFALSYGYINPNF